MNMKMGLIVNPIAGRGGKVGLKGTDNVLKEAIKRGATPTAPQRAVELLKRLKQSMAHKELIVLTCPGIMGENEATMASFRVQTLFMRIKKRTTAEDTKKAAVLLTQARVDLIVFVGGDGTAKDIFDAMQGTDEVPVLGVPAGVKVYSGVFATSPADAADIVSAFAEGKAEISELEVMDADEEAIRSDAFSVKLYGFLKAPSLPMHIQGIKQISPETDDEKDNQTAIARFIIEEMQPDATLILGPGTTVRRVAELLGVAKTLLGVDVYEKGRVILDVNEERILETVKNWDRAWIVLSPIGHQGILLGRGNQQISPDVVRRVGKERLIVAATKSKLQSIERNILRVDTGDSEVDEMLKGYIRVVTDYKEWRLVQVQ